MARNTNFDILSFSETWFDPSVSNVCSYVKTTLKAKVVKEFSGYPSPECTNFGY